MKFFRILSIDGGGVRGYLAASILANVETYLDQKTNSNVPVGRRFDLIAGTSTGALIALALALGQSAAAIKQLYTELIPNVFGEKNKRSRVTSWTKALYGSQVLRAQLQKLLGDAVLDDLVY